jgi:16S rRNA (cytosine967-C5)-methyltransferase
MYVMDLCAGAGGKTLHLAALMRNQGEIKAFDVEENKLRELHRRSKRAKVSIIKTELITSTSTLEKHTKWADRLLVDAPCSGLGTLKRNPEIKWNLDEGQLIAYQETQRKLLSKAAPLIQPKGKLIYATCSILPSENENQIDWFIKENPEFKLEEEIKISADSSKFDGFYMARLTRE